ncbi:glycosyltransferase family protein [Flavobacterium psychrotrophum]|uniref:glycosyltransferase family protein n=1 Tax=Flavobacterium psychrotrophum TaxID=2294119 RepID=UPI000E32001C|nr:glycosyltransferase [Flavobacterium psychrotrophum]
MKILLVGEYSRLHNSLKEGLESLGHQAVIVSDGDSFKNYGSQYSVRSRYFVHPFLNKIRKGIYKLTGTDFEKTERGLRFLMLLPQLKDFNYIQLINSDAIGTHPWLSKIIYKKLAALNAPISLLVCGDETPVIDYALSEKLRYSILTPYLDNNGLAKMYQYTLKYGQSNYRNVFNFLAVKAQSIITSDLDYEIPMQAMGYKTHFIANPINTNKIHFLPLEVKDKVVIFLGINRLSYIKKGIVFFEKALEIIAEKYTDKAEIIITENIPYAEYIKIYDRAHILLDQVYAYDQGYNALEAMAKGKVVFTGAESEFMAHYNLTEPVNYNALPDAKAIADSLSYLIENPDEIIATGKRARAFIEKEHDYKRIAGRYLEVFRGVGRNRNPF